MVQTGIQFRTVFVGLSRIGTLCCEGIFGEWRETSQIDNAFCFHVVMGIPRVK